MKLISLLTSLAFVSMLSACNDNTNSQNSKRIEGVYKKMNPVSKTVQSSYTFNLDGTVVAQRGTFIDPVAPYKIEGNTIKVGGGNEVNLTIDNANKIGYAGGVFEK